jgi:hypothetical protein
MEYPNENLSTYCCNIDPALITPEIVRGFSLGEITERYGTIGLYAHLVDVIKQKGFEDSDLIQTSLQLGLALHADDKRTNGHYTDHLMRVTAHLLETLNITDPDIIAAAPLHDIFEDHPVDLVYALTGERELDPQKARKIGHEVLVRLTNVDVVEIIESVTNPIVMPGQDKFEIYTSHITDLVENHPKGRVLKVADFIDNACGNNATIGPKQRRLDEKYIGQYRTHMMGLFLPDSLVVGRERQHALHLLSKGHARALGRLAAKDLVTETFAL